MNSFKLHRPDFVYPMQIHTAILLKTILFTGINPGATISVAPTVLLKYLIRPNRAILGFSRYNIQNESAVKKPPHP